ncbi:MAG: class I SAM-dependent methyltransferase [Bacteroidetes bacterium]|nr:MAG: class I SAM-dependent methyltransferase [Bacteroidota bacterium]
MREEGLARLQNLYPKRNTKDYLVLRYLVRDLKEAIERYGGAAVFDIGCGNKPYQQLFKSQNLLYRGCDVVQSDQRKVDVVCEATEIPEPAAMYDTILCTQVLEHVSSPNLVIREAFRLLQPGGYFILSVPFAWELHEVPHDYYRYSKFGITELLSSNGFEVVTLKSNGGKWAAVFQLNINMIYSSFAYGGFLRKGLKFAFLHLGFTSVLNRIAVWADAKWYDELLTLNYVVVARKTQ